MTTVSNFKYIDFKISDEIAFLTISREDKLNALNGDLLNELKSCLKNCANEKYLGMILTGAGDKSFVAGADISEMADMNPNQAKEFGKLGQEVTCLFEDLSFPVIACVNGYALGGGCELAMSADWIYATNNAVFGQPEVKLGLIPGFGGTQRLTRLVGRNKAKEIIFTARNVKIEEAAKIGLVQAIFDDKQSMIEQAKKVLSKMGSLSPLAIQLSKESINEGENENLNKALEIELNKFSDLFNSAEVREGTKAFLEKRAPSFRGKD